MDDLDRKLLVSLKEDARKPFLKLAKELNVSDATVHKHVAALEESGVITGYSAKLDAEKLGFGITAFIELRIKPGTADIVGEKLAKIPRVLDIYELHSHCDFLIRVQVRDIHELRNELVARITTIPEIVSKETNVVLNTVKSVSGPPI
jgi:DNA-binding Lrp family transcriptional regulator